mgnify:CR=1 FL=1
MNDPCIRQMCSDPEAIVDNWTAKPHPQRGVMGHLSLTVVFTFPVADAERLVKALGADAPEALVKAVKESRARLVTEA